MKKLLIWVIFLFFILPSHGKNKMNSSSTNIVCFPTIQQDTIIGNYFISYLIKDNDNIISRQGITSEGDTILLKYPDRSVILNLKRKDNGDTILSNKEINKYIFESLIPKEDDINQYQLWFFEIKNVDVDKVTFDLNICIPDTDICYFFNLCVSDDGNITITEIELNEEEE